MQTNEDKQLREFFHQRRAIDASPLFTQQVMSRLPHRSIGSLWSKISLILIWSALLIWVWVWHDTLIRDILSLTESMLQKKVPESVDLISYGAFLGVIMLVSWQTLEFFLQTTSTHNRLKA